MPLNNPLRRRRQLSSSRSITARRSGLSGLAQLLPKAMILPIILFAGVTAAAAAFWTYDIHIEQAYGDLDEPVATGSVDSAN